MSKKAVIVISLVPESIDVSNNQIKKEIQKEASIPWIKKIEKVTIIEKCRRRNQNPQTHEEAT